MTEHEIINHLLKQFDEDVSISLIAQYAEEEFFIPYKRAVRVIYDSVKPEV